MARGLNYTVTPDKVQNEDVIMATEKAALKLLEELAVYLTNNMVNIVKNAKPHKPNQIKK